MGWSAKHGLRPNRPRRVTVYEDGKAVRRFPTPREPGYRVVGVLTRAIAAVRRLHTFEPNSPNRAIRFQRGTWTQTFRLHPTKGYRVDSPVRKLVETSKNSRQPEGWKLGIHVIETFSRAR